MDRHRFFLPMLGLIVAGCATGRATMPERETAAQPRGGPMVPLPTIGDPDPADTPPTARMQSPTEDPTVVDPPPSRTDPALRTTSYDPDAATRKGAEARSEVDSGKLVGTTVATVGGVPIGLRELQDAVLEWQRTTLPKGEKLPPDQLNMLATNILEQLIDRQLFVQEAKRSLLKSDKQRQMFDDFATKTWQDQEIPRLVRKHKCSGELELRRKLADQGRSLELMRQNFLAETLAREFVRNHLKGKLSEPAPQELYSYYQSHLDEFQRPASVTWREIVVKIPPGTDRAEASRKAAALLDRLRRGEDFATIAKSDSQGPTAAKGGLWETAPGASALPAVNAAMASLALNTVGPVIEGPNSLHIVRVEARQEAGPIPWDEGTVQRDIANKLKEGSFQKVVEAYTKGLRAATVITYHIGQGPENSKPSAPADPKARRVSTAPSR